LKVVNHQPSTDVKLKEVVGRVWVEELKDRQRRWRTDDKHPGQGSAPTRKCHDRPPKARDAIGN
jgi:hypothetical protein